MALPDHGLLSIDVAVDEIMSLTHSEKTKRAYESALKTLRSNLQDKEPALIIVPTGDIDFAHLTVATVKHYLATRQQDGLSLSSLNALLSWPEFYVLNLC